jgi:replicative DNA helicase
MATRADEVRSGRAERVPPHNEEAEQAVLGAMMLSGEAIAQVADLGLRADDFYRSGHRAIFGTLTDLYARGEPVDVVTAKEELQRQGTLDSVGGPLYVQHLVEQVGTPASAGHYARIVGDHALLRRLIGAAGEILRGAYEIPEDPESFADRAEGEIYGVSRRHQRDQVVTIRELVHQSMEDLERIHERTGLVGVPTGFRDLDEMLQGLQKGNLIIVAARPGIGKSSLVTNIARNVAVESQVPVALFSLEMSRVEIGMRLLCSEARVQWHKVRAGMVAAEDWGRIVEAAEVLDPASLFIVDSGNVTIVDIRAKARRLKSQHQLGVIIVDYLQLMTSHQRIENRQQEVAEISRSLKLLAKELDVPVIAVSQLNRDPERRTDKKPQLADLRECVTGDTLVTLADGRRVPVRLLVGTTPEVLAVSEEGRIVLAKSDKVWRVGRRRVFRVELASGRSIRATSKHRLLGAEGWVRVADLSVGDRVAIARTLPEPDETIEWPEDRVALLGQLIGDGSYLSNQPLRYVTASEDNSMLVARAAEREFGCRVKRYRGRGAWHQLLISGNGDRWRPAGVDKWLRDLGIFGQRSHEKRIPEEAFRLTNRQIASLVRHLWATDGCISVRSRRRSGPPAVHFSTSSLGLAQDVAALLLRLGIVSRIRTVRPPVGRPCHSVNVSGGESQRRFLAEVGAFGPRSEQAVRLGAYLASTGSGTNVDTLPIETFDRVQAVMASRGISTREMAVIRGTASGGGAHFRFAPSRASVAEYAEILDDDVLRSRATSDLFWDRVVGIHPDEDEDVFDLTVPGPESWLADSVISHNSGALEQDADIVMFIHRDPLSEDMQAKGTAEVIVAKHRNGPVGKITLTWLEHLTLFRNFAREQ